MARGVKTGGRKKGTPNKLTASAREAFAAAFRGLGGSDGLMRWAEENQTEFYKLYARLIPVELEHGVTNDLSELLEAIDGRTRGIPTSR